MKKIFFVVLLMAGALTVPAQKPTKEAITAAMKRFWEQDKGPRKTVTIQLIEIGKSETATLKQQVEGVPKGALVTHAVINWSLHSHYTDQTQTTQRLTHAWVFKDENGDWRVKTYKSQVVK